MPDSDASALSSVRRAAHVLVALANNGPIGVRALSRAVGLPAASTQRILNDLALESMAEQHDEEWILGHRAIDLGRLHLGRLDLVRIAKPHCERIAAEVGESVNIVVRSGFLAVCIDKTSGGSEAFQLDWPVGVPGPLYCGGAGKAILAFSGAPAQEAVLARPLTPLTPHTITSAPVLREEIGRIRQRGYSLDRQEVAVGVWCIAVPILDSDGVAIAALSISGPRPKDKPAGLEALIDRLMEACSTTSRYFGYAGEWPGRSKREPRRA